jgi:hypothetical protein
MALYGRARNARLLVVTLVMLSLVTITVDYRAKTRRCRVGFHAIEASLYGNERR